jgi:ApeA N-terminal domain 1
MAFLLSDIDRTFQRHLRNWFRLRYELGPVLDFYFSTLHVSAGFMQTRFMNYVQAIEGYHRRRLSRLMYPEGEFKAHRDAIVAGAPSNLRPLARKALAQHVNEVSLSERVADVLVELEGVATSVLTSGQRSCKRFAMRVAEIRNIYAHVLDKPEPEPGELVTLTYQVKTLVEALLLREVGFNLVQIDAMLKQTGKYELIEIMRAYERGRTA